MIRSALWYNCFAYYPQWCLSVTFSLFRSLFVFVQLFRLVVLVNVKLEVSLVESCTRVESLVFCYPH